MIRSNLEVNQNSICEAPDFAIGNPEFVEGLHSKARNIATSEATPRLTSNCSRNPNERGERLPVSRMRNPASLANVHSVRYRNTERRSQNRKRYFLSLGSISRTYFSLLSQAGG
jgi:hypothetical protein